MTRCSAMFPQCMTRVNNPADCDCPTVYSFRSDPDETKGRAIGRSQAAVEARRSIGRKVTLLPESKLDEMRNVRKQAISDIIPKVKSKQDQNMARTNINPEIYRAFEDLVSLDRSPAQAFDIGWTGGYEAGARDTETRFWQIIDRDGLSGLPSDTFEALDILARKHGIAREDSL